MRVMTALATHSERLMSQASFTRARGFGADVSSSRNSGIWYQNEVRVLENCCIPITFRLTAAHTPAYASGVRAT
jgi:hypothetical protein